MNVYWVRTKSTLQSFNQFNYVFTERFNEFAIRELLEMQNEFIITNFFYEVQTSYLLT